MSDEIGADVADDDEFFDQLLNGQGTRKKPTAERRLSLSPDNVNASSPRHRSGSRSSSDESISDHSSKEKRRASVDEESYDRGTRPSSAKHAVVIPLPSDSHQDEGQASDDSQTSDEGRNDLREPVQKQPPPITKKSKKPSGGPKAIAGIKNKNHGKKNITSVSMSSCSKSGYSADEEKRRPVSSTSSSQQLGTYKISRAISAPLWRPQQSRPGSGFSNNSRMDVKMLLESLLLAESSRPRRKSVGNLVEFQRRRNYTFGDERLEMIERENKRLLEKIVKIHYSEPAYSRASQKRATPVKPTAFPDVARIKQLEKIEKENLELLQRLQSTQPSRDVSRDALIADYNRNRAYLNRGCYYVAPQANSSRRRHANSESRPSRSGQHND